MLHRDHKVVAESIRHFLPRQKIHKTKCIFRVQMLQNNLQLK